MVKNLPSNAEGIGDTGSIPGQGTKIPHASGHRGLHPTTREILYTARKTQHSQKKRRQAITSVGEDVEEREPSCTMGGDVNWCSHYGKQNEGFSKKKKRKKKKKYSCNMVQQFHYRVYIQKK